MRVASMFLIAASMLGAAAPADLAFAQSTPADVRDLVGARGSSGEQALTSRGYVNVGGQTGDDRVWTYWWNEQRGACLTVATVGGRYDSIVSGPAADCRRNTRPVPSAPASAGQAAASGQTETIQFARGTSSATRRATITGYETRTYLLTLRAGQTLNVNLQTSNRSGYFNVTAPGAQEALFVGSTSGASYAGRTPSNGVYKIDVYLMRNAARRGESARYTLTVGAR